jgi:hypothetical protein
MRCNNVRCKYYKPAEKSGMIDKMMWGHKFVNEGGCKYSFCRRKGNKK